jgi:hypothetical protein
MKRAIATFIFLLATLSQATHFAVERNDEALLVTFVGTVDLVDQVTAELRKLLFAHHRDAQGIQIIDKDGRLTIRLKGIFTTPELTQDDAALLHDLNSQLEARFALPIERVVMEDPVQLQTCSVCYSEVEKLVSLGCKNHAFCEGCQADHVKAKLSVRESQIKCMAQDCKSVLNMDLADGLLTALQKWKIGSAIRHEKMISNGKSRTCLCGRFLCGSLNWLVCFGMCCCAGCCIPIGVEQCPRCHIVIEYNGGCNHISCKKCGHEFTRGRQCNVPCYCCVGSCYCPSLCDRYDRSCNCWAAKI